MELTKKAVSGIMLTLLLIGMLTITFNAPSVKADEEVPPPEKFLIITLDKETYYQGDIMTITVENISNETVWFTGTAYNLFFERFNGTNWQFHTSIVEGAAMTPLEPRETGQIKWKLDVPLQPFPAGHYRVGTKGVYAEFDVFVPKSRLLLLETDKDVYVLGELVTFTLTNIGNETVHFGGWPFLKVYTWPNWESVAPAIFAFLLWKLDPGQSSSWTWNQTNEYTRNPVEAGFYVAKDIYGYNYTTFFRIIDATDPVPEFPSALILPLFMILSIIAVISAKRRLPRKPEN